MLRDYMDADWGRDMARQTYRQIQEHDAHIDAEPEQQLPLRAVGRLIERVWLQGKGFVRQLHLEPAQLLRHFKESRQPAGPAEQMAERHRQLTFVSSRAGSFGWLS